MYQRAGYRCQMCGRSNVRLHAHHMVPISRGGPTSSENLASVCEDCHSRLHPHMRRRSMFHLPSFGLPQAFTPHYQQPPPIAAPFGSVVPSPTIGTWNQGPLGNNLLYAVGMRGFLGRNDYGVPWGGLWNYALGGPSWMRSY